MGTDGTQSTDRVGFYALVSNGYLRLNPPSHREEEHVKKAFGIVLAVLVSSLSFSHFSCSTKSDSKLPTTTTPPPTMSTQENIPITENKMDTSQGDDNFAELLSTLLDDTLEMIPIKLAKKIAPDDNLDSLMEGAFSDEPAGMNFLTSTDLGAQAAYVVDMVYMVNEEGLKEGYTIPQSMYFEVINLQKETVSGAIKKRKNKLSGSNNPNRDKYNLCLNVLINLWIENFSRQNRSVVYKKPREGVYLRDNDHKLYPYMEG